MGEVGRLLVLVGLGTALLGGLLWGLSVAAPGLRLGRLPGDFVVDQGGFRLYLPITTMLLVSAVLTLVVWLVGALRK